MKLKKLEIFGFKSFLDKVGIEFPSGVCAVVGPNGCGKSNVFDALRWVMGEQSVKQLRGKSMEDVIFSGAGGCSPLNMAEVSLTLYNDGNMVPEELRDFSEIMITRRLYRSGESTYLINKRPCRLKDIHNIFLGSGLGAKSYAFIQQGRIGAITDAGPEERRFFVEEAAGVTRYKQRKDEALRKLEATQNNLLRINDILFEVERQMNGLRQQARKAEHFNRCQAQITELDVRLALQLYDCLLNEMNKAQALINEFQDAESAQNTRLKTHHADLERIKLSQLEKHQFISSKKAEKFELHRSIDKVENDSIRYKEDGERLSKEIAEFELSFIRLKEKNESIMSEMEQIADENMQTQGALKAIEETLSFEHAASRQLRERFSILHRSLEENRASLLDLSAKEAKYHNMLQHAVDTQEALKRRLHRVNEQEMLTRAKVIEAEERVHTARVQQESLRYTLEDIKSRISVSERELVDLTAALEKLVKKCNAIQLERKVALSQFATLKNMVESYDWCRDGVKAILGRRGIDNNVEETCSESVIEGVLGIVADVLEPEATYEMALEAALGESLQYVLVRSCDVGDVAIDYLKRFERGRSGFVPILDAKAVVCSAEIGQNLEKRLLNFVTVRAGFEMVAEVLLGHVKVVENLSEALSLFHGGADQTVVTRNGDLVTHQGIMIGGSQDKMTGILVNKREMRALREQITNIDQALEAVRLEQSHIENRKQEVQIGVQQLIKEKNQAVRDELEADKAHYKASEDLNNIRHHLEILQLEQEQLLGEEADISGELTRFKDDLDNIRKSIQVLQKEMEGVSNEIGVVSEELKGFDQRIMDAKLTQTNLSARLQNGDDALKRLADYQSDGKDRLVHLAQDIEMKKGLRVETLDNVAKSAVKLADLYGELEALAKVITDNEKAYAEILEVLQEKNQTAADIQDKREKLVENIRSHELDQSQRKLRLENISNRLEERYQRTFCELKERYFDPTDERSSDKMEAELFNLRQRIKNIGEVNPGAIKEYQAQKERYAFLSTQRDDLNSAVEDLQKVIRKINKVTQERFLDTLMQVNEKLKEVFPRLFGGGTAELLLSEPGNPLDSGIEFMVHPPGKKVTRLSLLSGGEKALSAIAFVFSIFLIKPASFCLMDEIDAPLDESNVFRFNELLRVIGEQSQIVMITHNKRSMEFADTLFGVTMEQKGISKIVSVCLERREAA